MSDLIPWKFCPSCKKMILGDGKPCPHCSAKMDGRLNMEAKEAIIRIKNHNEIHSKQERFAVHITQALELAVEALEKQTPQKPVDVKRTGNKIHTAKCPRCESRFPDIGGIYEFYDECEQPEYCGECGQALDWGADHGNLVLQGLCST